MRPPVLVATTGWDVERWARRVGAFLPDREFLCTDRRGVFHGSDEKLSPVRYILAWKPLQETLDRLPNLDAIFSLGAGVDHILTLKTSDDVPIVRMVGHDLTARMTEYVAWQVLHHLRLGAAYARHQKQHSWHAIDPPAASQLTVGIMGLGIMGASAADMLLRLGFRVRSWTRGPKSVPGVESFHGRSSLDPFLQGTDILVSLLPLTPETTGILDAALIRKLRRTGPLGGAVLINAGRGGSQVEADIVEALRDGTLAGASLDVFQTEPLPADSPLWDFDNVVITPHVAAASDPDALAGQVAAQIEAFERGEPLTNCVDRERGY